MEIINHLLLNSTYTVKVILIPCDDCDDRDDRYDRYCGVCVNTTVSPPPPSSPKKSPHFLLFVIFIIVAAFFSVGIFALIMKFISKSLISRRSQALIHTNPLEVDDDDGGGDDDGNHSPVHHIWYITTVGLEESVIKSITVCKFNRGEGLIEGTDCSVCLSEFRDGEDVRLLPKCSHAFHLPCIDTWLRSNVNCPLCRALIVPNSSGDLAPNAVLGSSSREDEARLTDLEGDVGGLERRQPEEEVELDAHGQSGGDAEEMKEVSFPIASYGFLVGSDLLDGRRLGELENELGDGEMEPVRRSVSMDSVPASTMNIAWASPSSTDIEGGTSTVGTQLGERKKPNSVQLLRQKRNTSSRSQRMSKLVGGYAKGDSLMQPILMKRSLSVGGKFLLSRNGRGRNTILPF